MSSKAKAIIAHGLMLLNLLFPIAIFIALFIYWLRHRHDNKYMVMVAVNQAFIASVLSTTLFIFANILIIVFAQYKSTFALIVFELYFILVIPIFLIPGLLGLVKANADTIYYYPVIGKKYQEKLSP